MLSFAGHTFVDVLRSTAFVLDAAEAAVSMTPDRGPARRGRFDVSVQGGTANTGTVTLTGTLDGSPQVEVLTFTGSSVKRCAELFDGLTLVETSGLADETAKPTLSVKAVDEDGSAQPTTYTVAADRPADVSYGGGGDWPTARSGSHDDDEALIGLPYEEVYAPRRGDMVRPRDTAEVWLVRSARPIPSKYQPQLWELRCTKYTP